MADFGKAGTRTARRSDAAGIVRVAESQSLICTLDVLGAVPAFEFGCEHHPALFHPGGLVQNRYQWSEFDDAHDGEGGDVHVLVLKFSAARRYRFLMQVFDANMALVATLKDVDYESPEPTDVATEPVRLFVR